MLKYFWIAEYNDKTALPQFDPETGKENLFKDIDQSKLVRFGWYPFPEELTKKVTGSISNPFLPKYVINLNKDDILIARRRTYIQLRGHQESRYIDYLLGTQKYLICIDEFGNVEVRNGDL